jgi:Domain of unknown function (DUF222)
MSEEASTPGPAADGDDCGSSRPGLWPGEGRPCLSEDDLLALLDGLGVPGTHDPEEDQEAIAEAEWQARQAAEYGPFGQDGTASWYGPVSPDGTAGQGSTASQHSAGRPGGTADDTARPDDEGRVVSPVLVGECLPAGPGLAAVLAQDPAGLATDWDLPGLAAGYRRLAAWAQARELDAAAEIAARRAAANPRIGTTEHGRPASVPAEAAAEIALELSMTQPSASTWTVLGCRLRWDLPLTGAALAAGTIDLPRARIIADATAWLSPEHAAVVEARVVPAAAGQTTSQLRAAVRRAVLAIDPDGAEQRRRDTERTARISLYPGEEGTASLTGSCLPGLQAAAAMARITAIARALKSSGAHGGIDLLRAHVYLGLLLGTLPLIPPPPGAPPDNPPDPGDLSPPGGGPGEGGPGRSDDDGTPGNGSTPGDGSSASQTDDNPADHSPSSPAPEGGAPDPGVEDLQDLPGWWPDVPPPTDADAPPDDSDPPAPVPVLAPDPDDGDDDWPQLPPPHWPRLPAHLPAPPDPAPAGAGGPSPGSLLARTGLLDVLIPWTTLTGHSREPAIVGRIGPVSSWQARELVALATRNPATQWRVILTTDDGRAIAVHHARPPQAPGHNRAPGTDTYTTGVIGRVTITIRAASLGTPAARPRPDTPLTIQHLTPAILTAAAQAAERAAADGDRGDGSCAHTMASESYRPPPRLREHITARDRTCRFGPCGQPAWRTDLDHTTPWHQDGPTCPCNLGSCCRTHHQIKQHPGWHLHQPNPGTFTWTTPTGRTYQTQPDPYPV